MENSISFLNFLDELWLPFLHSQVCWVEKMFASEILVRRNSSGAICFVPSCQHQGETTYNMPMK